MARAHQQGVTTDSDQRDPQTFAIIGAAMAVHTELGCGFLEPVYAAALALELAARRIVFRREVPFAMTYKGCPLALNYRVDFVCFGQVVVEVKAVKAIGPLEHAQAINYLKVSRLARALILNFGSRSLEFQRLVSTSR